MASSVNKIDLNILMIGKTGGGKSATGNLILNRKEFISSSNVGSTTKCVKDAYAEIGSLSIKVVDGPGLEDTDLTERENIITACENMAKSLVLCNGGVHTFVLVLKFGDKFMREDKSNITLLKDIYGPNYLKERGIIVLTCGDQFPVQMQQEETPRKTFMQWCQDQVNDIKTLFEECNYRIILFNNVTATEEEKQRQRNELLYLAHEISKERGMYTSEHFQQFAEIREKLIQSKLTILRESVQKKINLLTAGLGCLTETSLEKDFEQVEAQTTDLQMEIETYGVDESVLELVSMLGDVQKTLEELKQGKNKKSLIEKLEKQRKEFDEIRQNKIPWTDILILIGIIVGTVPGVVVLTAITIAGNWSFANSLTRRVAATVTDIISKIRRRRENKKITKSFTNLSKQE